MTEYVLTPDVYERMLYRLAAYWDGELGPNTLHPREVALMRLDP